MFNKLLPKGSKNRDKIQEIYFNALLPKSISKNYLPLDENQQISLATSLNQNFNYAENEINFHLDSLKGRLRDHRIKIIPWLNSVKSLKGTKILEIGCGNGTSTVALAEQGAIVTAIDLDENLLKDAINRCKTYNLKVEFHLMNATEVASLLAHHQYDMIIFYAVLEHMTYEERLSAIKSTFDMLPPDGFWVVIDTPNRLHFYDSHTAMMPFFHWLPDELAIKYAQFSTRNEFKKSFENVKLDEEKKLEFARWGRGMSFHEFELSLLIPIHELKIVSTLSDFLVKRSFLYSRITKFTPNARYSSFLKKQFPTIHTGFFQPFLNLIIQKNK